MFNTDSIVYEELGDNEDNSKRYRIKIKNLDKFLQQIYSFYFRKGYYCILIENIVNIFIMTFIICYAITLTSFIDYNILLNKYDLPKALDISMSNISFPVYLFLVVTLLFLFKQIISTFFELISFYKIKRFYNEQLNICDKEIETINWNTIVKKLCALNNLHHTNNSLTPLEIINRIMRKDNYIIAMINKNILNFDFDLPFIGYQPFFTKTIEWSIYLTIIDFMFDENNSLKIDFLRSDLKFKLIETLKYRFYFIGIFSLLLSPFILVILGLYYLFKYGEEYKNQSNFIASRQWSLYAKWKFRQFNELIDNFQKRMNKSHKSAINYVNQFPSYKMFNIFRLFEFITGAFICFIVALTIYDDEVLTKLNVFENRSALWALGLLGTMLTLFRCYKIEDNFIFEPIIIMKDVVKNTHCIPENWKNKCHKEEVANMFKKLFEYKILLFLYEILGVIITPFILLIYLPTKAEKIIEFIRDSSTDVNGIGHICSFAAFNIDYINGPYSENNLQLKSNDSKFEISYINFTEEYSACIDEEINNSKNEIYEKLSIKSGKNINSTQDCINLLNSTEDDNLNNNTNITESNNATSINIANNSDNNDIHNNDIHNNEYDDLLDNESKKSYIKLNDMQNTI